MFMKRKALFSWAARIALLVLVLSLCGCSAGGAAGDAEGPPGSSGGSSIVADGVDRKIVYYVDLEMETDNVSAVRDHILSDSTEAGGYVEQRNDYGSGDNLSRVYLVLRIPTAKLDAFVEAAGEEGTVRSKRVSSTDITTEYVSASARKAAYEERKSQLEAILAEEGLSASDRIAVIDSVSEVNAALQEIELQLTQYDSLVDYSTVRLEISRSDNVWEIVGTVLLVLLFAGLAAGVIVFGIKYEVEKRKNRPGPSDRGGQTDNG